MFYDPFAEDSLVAYLDAANCYTDAVDDMAKLACQGKHAEFVTLATRVRKLAVQAETAYAAMKLSRSRPGAHLPG